MNTSQQVELYLTCPLGLEEALARECAGIGVEKLRLEKAGLACLADFRMAMRLCLWSRVASRVLWPLFDGEVSTREQLYDAVGRVAWEGLFNLEQTFALNCNSRDCEFATPNFAALVAKDAIADRFRRVIGARPSVDREQPDIHIDLHLNGTHARLSLDLAGESLHKRGWRRSGGLSPLKENLAAGILILCGCAPGAEIPVLDPMCGSGTFLVEAGLLLCDTAPGLFRQDFCFRRLKTFVPAQWEELLAEARQRDRRETWTGARSLLFGYDSNPASVLSASDNVAAAGLGQLARVEFRDLALCEPPAAAASGIFVTNPPYGRRHEPDTDLAPLYKQLGDVLKQRFQGWDGWILTTAGPLSKSVGLKTSARIPVFNGPLECRLLHFRLYSGSRA